MINAATPYVLTFIGFNTPDDFVVTKSKLGLSIEWYTASPQPTEAEIDAAEISQAFIDWSAEHGGDPVKTLRRQAKEALSENKAESALLRSALLAIVDELNRHSDKTNAILDAIDGASNLSGLKTAIGTINNLPQRTGAQLRTAAETKLAAGDADT